MKKKLIGYWKDEPVYEESKEIGVWKDEIIKEEVKEEIVPKNYTKKYCRWCSDEFTPSSHNNAYCSSKCKDKAHKDSYYKRNYGIGYREYLELLDKHNQGCWICGVSRAKAGSDIALAVDHDHKTGLVRGLLCAKCNKGIGLLGDNLKGIKKAMKYLELEPTKYKKEI